MVSHTAQLFLFYFDDLELHSHFVARLEEYMNRLDDEPKNREFEAEQHKQPQQPGTPEDQPSEISLRRPQNFNDWGTNRREDDPTR